MVWNSFIIIFLFFSLCLIFAYTASKNGEKIRLLYGSLRVYGSIIFGNKKVGQKCVDNTRGCLPLSFSGAQTGDRTASISGNLSDKLSHSRQLRLSVVMAARRSITFDRFRICAQHFYREGHNYPWFPYTVISFSTLFCLTWTEK